MSATSGKHAACTNKVCEASKSTACSSTVRYRCYRPAGSHVAFLHCAKGLRLAKRRARWNNRAVGLRPLPIHMLCIISSKTGGASNARQLLYHRNTILLMVKAGTSRRTTILLVSLLFSRLEILLPTGVLPNKHSDRYKMHQARSSLLFHISQLGRSQPWNHLPAFGTVFGSLDESLP